MTPLNGNITTEAVARTIKDRIASGAAEARIACETCTNRMLHEIKEQTKLNCYFDYRKACYIFTTAEYSAEYREENNLTVFK